MTTPMNPPPSTTPSPLIRQPSSGLFTTSDFESMSHEQLRAMIEQADPSGTENLGAKLMVAAVAIKKLGEDLKAEMPKVDWEGQGGDAFREWGADMANATLRLGDYSHRTGSWMIEAAQTLSLVKSSMPEVSTESKTVLASFRSANPGQVGAIAPPTVSNQGSGLSSGPASGPSQAQAYAAQRQLDADRAEAAQLMRRLAQSYAWSAHQISTGERPTFRPMPQEFVPPPSDGVERTRHLPSAGPSGGGQGYGRQGGGGRASSGSTTSAVATPALRGERRDAALSGVSPGTARVGLAPEHRGVVLPTERTGTVVDSVTPVPTSPPATPRGETDAHAVGRTAGGSPSSPGVVPPPVATSVGQPVGGRVSPSMRPVAPTGQGVGVVRPGTAVPRVSEPGIVGGRSVSPGQELPGGQTSRGTVIGGEGQGQAQGRMPMGAGPAFGGPAGSAGRGSGVAIGRRLATEPGGVVGGGSARRPGSAGEFTSGGTGLVRSRPAMDGNPSTQGSRSYGFPGTSPIGGATERRAQGGRRPDYLVEEEETWSQGNRRIVPPVID